MAQAPIFLCRSRPSLIIISMSTAFSLMGNACVRLIDHGQDRDMDRKIDPIAGRARFRGSVEFCESQLWSTYIAAYLYASARVQLVNTAMTGSGPVPIDLVALGGVCISSPPRAEDLDRTYRYEKPLLWVVMGLPRW